MSPLHDYFDPGYFEPDEFETGWAPDAQIGAPVVQPLLAWTLQFDWNNDGSFDPLNEAVNLVGLQIRRGRSFVVRPDGNGFERWMVGTATLTLNNPDGRYDPYNQRSPLYPNVKPGRYARLSVRAAEATWPVFFGRIADIRGMRDPFNPQVQMTIEDGWAFARERVVNTLVYHSMSTDWAILILFGMHMYWRGGFQVQGTGRPMSYWWAGQTRGDDAINSLMDYEVGGVFRFGAGGGALFRSRSWLAANEQTTLTLSQPDVQREVGLPQPWEIVHGRVRVMVNGLQVKPTAELWRFGEIPYIAPNSEIQVWAIFQHEGQNVVADATIPVPGTDYRANTMPDESGQDLTQYFTIPWVEYATCARAIVKNNGSVGGYLTLFRIRGEPILDADSAFAEATGGAAAGGTFTLDTPWIQSLSAAQETANYLAGQLSAPRPLPTVMVVGRPDIQFKPDIGDRVRLVLPDYGVDGDYRVGLIEHEWVDRAGMVVRTCWRFEPLLPP